MRYVKLLTAFFTRVDLINFRTTTSITIKYFRLVQLAVIAGAVLGIIGAEQAKSSSSPKTMTYIAVLCYVAAYAAIVLIFCLALPYSTREYVPNAERPLTPAIGIALPLVLVRLAYQVLVVFVHRGAFSRLGKGSVGVHVAMAVVEEFLVVAIYLYLGFRLDKLEADEQGPILSRPWKNRGSKGSRRSKSRRRGRSERGYAEHERTEYLEQEDRRYGQGARLQSVDMDRQQAYS